MYYGINEYSREAIFVESKFETMGVWEAVFESVEARRAYRTCIDPFRAIMAANLVPQVVEFAYENYVSNTTKRSASCKLCKTSMIDGPKTTSNFETKEWNAMFIL